MKKERGSKRCLFIHLVNSRPYKSTPLTQPVFGEGYLNKMEQELEREEEIAVESARAWYHKVGDYLENPHRHFKLIDSLTEVMDWPEEIKDLGRGR